MRLGQGCFCLAACIGVGDHGGPDSEGAHSHCINVFFIVVIKSELSTFIQDTIKSYS